MSNTSFKNPDLDFYIGDEALNHQTTHDVRYILRSGQICDWEGIEKYWHRSIHSYLKCEPENHRFILTEPPMNTPENREQIAEIMFETFNVKGALYWCIGNTCIVRLNRKNRRLWQRIKLKLR
jgi:actin-related protein